MAVKVYTVRIKAEATVAVLAENEDAAHSAAMKITPMDFSDTSIDHIEEAEADDGMTLDEAQQNVIAHADIILDRFGRHIREEKAMLILEGPAP